jgi:membrane-bound metal-dependent hydrolase YbcI (DUF457 family)
LANFKTHLTLASTLSGVLAIGCLQGGMATPQDVWVYFAAGTMGGILPDIDSDHSIPIQIIFSFFATVLAFLTVFSKAGVYSIAELCFLWIGVYVAIRYVVCKLFARFTVHRGVFHSLLAALFFWFLATAVAYHGFAMPAFNAWLLGCFVGMGYIIHLTLDELYSVDLMGATLKKSFGTALKIVSLTYIKATIFLSIATLLLFYFATPKYDVFIQTLRNSHIYSSIHDKLLPKGDWFTE